MAYRLSSSEREDLDLAVNAIEANNPGAKVLGYDLSTQWLPVHGCKTSQMVGFKLGCRQDSAAPHYVWIGLCPCIGKRMQPRPLVQVCFAQLPTTNDLVAALRQEIQNAS